MLSISVSPSYIRALELIDGAKILPSDEILMRMEEMARKNAPVPNTCASCERKNIPLYCYNKQKKKFSCRSCLPLHQVFATGKGGGRLSDQTMSVMIATPQRVTLMTSLSDKNIKRNEGSNLEVKSHKETWNELFRLHDEQPKEFVVIPFSNRTIYATDLVLNIDPAHILFSGSGSCEGMVGGFNIEMAIHLAEILDGVSAVDFRKYVAAASPGGERDAAYDRIVSICPDIVHFHLSQSMPEIGVVCEILHEKAARAKNSEQES